MRRIHINGTSYACPFERHLPPHTAASLAALEADIVKRKKVVLPVIVFVSPTHGRCILDGITRATLAEKHEIADVPVDHWGDVPDDVATEMCLAVNILRRQIAPKDYDEVVLRMRRAGESIRGIAAVSGIPKGRVERIIEGAGMPTYQQTPSFFDDDDEEEEESLPETIRGRDGKEYPAKRKPEPPLAAAMPENIAEIAFTDNLAKLHAALLSARGRVAYLLRSKDPRGEELKKAARKHGVGVGREPEKWEALENLIQAVAEVKAA